MTTYVQCPICGEDDMPCEPQGDGEGYLIRCCNLGCASNQPLEKPPERVLEEGHYWVKEHGSARWEVAYRAPAGNWWLCGTNRPVKKDPAVIGERLAPPD